MQYGFCDSLSTLVTEINTLVSKQNSQQTGLSSKTKSQPGEQLNKQPAENRTIRYIYEINTASQSVII